MDRGNFKSTRSAQLLQLFLLVPRAPKADRESLAAHSQCRSLDYPV